MQCHICRRIIRKVGTKFLLGLAKAIADRRCLVPGWESKDETVSIGKIVNISDGHIGLRRRVNLLQNSLWQGFWDLQVENLETCIYAGCCILWQRVNLQNVHACIVSVTGVLARSQHRELVRRQQLVREAAGAGCTMHGYGHLKENRLNARNGVDTLDHFLHHLVDVAVSCVENHIYLLGSGCRHCSRRGDQRCRGRACHRPSQWR